MILSKVLNNYFQQIDIYKSIIIVDDTYPNINELKEDLLYNDFPVRVYSQNTSRELLDSRMYLVKLSDFNDLINNIDYENITVIFTVDDISHKYVEDNLVNDGKLFKCLIIKI